MSIKKLWNYLYRLYAVRDNVELGDNCHVGIGSVLWAPNKFKLGNNVYIGKNCTIECDGSIGNDVMIGNQVGIIGRHDHDFSVVGKSIRFAPWIGDADYHGKGKDQKVVIGDDCWIGYGSIVLSGVNIGKGSIIAAESIVTKDIEPYSVVAGSPAKVMGSRFTSEQIVEHEKILSNRK